MEIKIDITEEKVTWYIMGLLTGLIIASIMLYLEGA